MPGPVSDSYDPEFGTGANAHEVAHGAIDVRNCISQALGGELKDIVSVCMSPNGQDLDIRFCERELRIIRFCINRVLETL